MKDSFTVLEFTQFIDSRFRELYVESIDPNSDTTKFVRLVFLLITYLKKNRLIVFDSSSQSSCRTDIIRWGAKWDSNKGRPYFLGHEREDVVKKRKEFVMYMLDHQDFYYYPIVQIEGSLTWNIPMRNKTILFSHDESTFRSGEMAATRWFVGDLTPFYSKGRGNKVFKK